jgi:rod shape-determining protein MreB
MADHEITNDDIRRVEEVATIGKIPANREILEVVPFSYTLDGQGGIKDPIGMAGVRLEANFHIIAGQVKAIKNIVKCVNKAHLESQELILEPLASSESVLSDEEKEAGVVLVDIGGGTTEIAVIALSGIVCDQSIRVAGDNFDSDIVNYIRRQHNIMIGDRTAEKIKIEVGAALPELQDAPADFAVQGRDLMTGVPKQITVSYTEIAHCLDKSISKIEEAILKALEITPPELSADIYQTGIYLTGGGALLRGLDKRVAAKTKLPVHVAEDPLRAVVRGTGIALKNIGGYKFLMQ